MFFHMSDSKSSPGDSANKTVKRSLPSWMSDRENGSKARGKRSVDGGGQEESKEGEKPEQAKGNGGKSNNRPGASNLSTSNFSNLLVLNSTKFGFINGMTLCISY